MPLHSIPAWVHRTGVTWLEPARDLRGRGNRWAAPSSAAPRELYNTVTVAGATFLYPDSFRTYVDSTWARGFRSLRIACAWRMKCWQCAPDTIDHDTNPAPGVYDFSVYFDRLDYAIKTKGMKMQLIFAFAGRLASDPVSPGAQRVLPSFLGSSDVMLYRNSSGQDVPFSGGWESGNYTKSPRFEKASVRASILDYVTAVVSQFGERYGSAITGYGFTFGQFNETEYPIVGSTHFCDTSPEAAQVAMTHGPAAGLERVDALASEPSLKAYHLLPSVRGDFLAKLGRLDEARAEFERAATLTRNGRERTLLLERAAACARG